MNNQGAVSKDIRDFAAELEEKDANILFNCANDYGKGQEGVPQNKEKAVKLYEKAAAQEHAKAQYNLGNCYAKGQGIAQDYEKAAEWYKKAADQGHTEAQYNLAHLYESVKYNYEKATYYYQLAANQGHTEAQEAVTILKNNMQINNTLGAEDTGTGNPYTETGIQIPIEDSATGELVWSDWGIRSDT